MKQGLTLECLPPDVVRSEAAAKYWEGLSDGARESLVRNAAYVVEEYGFNTVEVIHGVLLTGG